MGFLIAASCAAAAHGAWKPPANPDPSKILAEAQADARAGRNADALAKHLWFHNNALKIQSTLYGVRLSFALGSWMDLGMQYPPAMEALKKARDQAGARVRQAKGTREDFRDFAAINDALREDAATTELFAWLDQRKPELARASYRVAQRALINTKSYKLCGKYIDSEASVERLVRLHQEHQRMIKEGRVPDDFRDYAETSFAYEATTLVALLVLNERAAEADRVATAILRERPDVGLKGRLERARAGEIPTPWP